MLTSTTNAAAGAKILVLWLVLASLVSISAAQVLLGTAQTFAVLGGSMVTNTGASVVTGDVGVAPGLAITDFPSGGGTLHAGDAVAQQAQADVTAAYNNLAGRACDTALTGQDLGGLTLMAGVYCFTSSAQLTGNLTLDAQGATNAEFIFQIFSTLVTATNSAVLLINGTNACNVFWQVGSSATISTATAFQGNIVALSSISLATGTTLSGRAIARTSEVTVDTSVISASNCFDGEPTGTSTATSTGGTTTHATGTTGTGTSMENGSSSNNGRIAATLASLLLPVTLLIL